MYSTQDTSELVKLLEEGELESFFNNVAKHEDDEKVGPVMKSILEEWQKLQIARKNGLMDEEQLYYAIRAFFKKKADEIPALLSDG
jgi:hypothetical protein